MKAIMISYIMGTYFLYRSMVSLRTFLHPPCMQKIKYLLRKPVQCCFLSHKTLLHNKISALAALCGCHSSTVITFEIDWDIPFALTIKALKCSIFFQFKFCYQIIPCCLKLPRCQWMVQHRIKFLLEVSFLVPATQNDQFRTQLAEYMPPK